MKKKTKIIAGITSSIAAIAGGIAAYSFFKKKKSDKPKEKVSKKDSGKSSK